MPLNWSVCNYYCIVCLAHHSLTNHTFISWTTNFTDSLSFSRSSCSRLASSGGTRVQLWVASPSGPVWQHWTGTSTVQCLRVGRQGQGYASCDVAAEQAKGQKSIPNSCPWRVQYRQGGEEYGGIGAQVHIRTENCAGQTQGDTRLIDSLLFRSPLINI